MLDLLFERLNTGLKKPRPGQAGPGPEFVCQGPEFAGQGPKFAGQGHEHLGYQVHQSLRRDVHVGRF